MNGAHVGLAFVAGLLLFVVVGGFGSWRDEVARIREADGPPQPPIDYDAYHSATLKDFLDKEAIRERNR